MNDKAVRALLQRRITSEADGNETEWARKNGLSQGYVTHVRKGVMPLGPKILSALGLRKDVRYLPVK